MKLVSWNYRGLGGRKKLESIKRFKNMEENSILIIQETKILAEECLKIMNKIWARGEGIDVSASGASRGLLTWWDKQRYSLCSASKNRNWLFVELEDKYNNETL